MRTSKDIILLVNCNGKVAVEFAIMKRVNPYCEVKGMIPMDA